MELQQTLDRGDGEASAVFAISYDDVDVLARFASSHDVRFPLLSDVGSHVIRELGLLNEHVAVQQAYYGRPVDERHEGLPHPGVFVLDERGVVVDKRFEQTYRVRPSSSELVTAIGSGAVPPAVEAVRRSGAVSLRAWVDAENPGPDRRTYLHTRVLVPDGLHVYGEPVPDGFTALQVRLDAPDDVTVGETTLPAGEPFSMEGLPDRFVVHTGRVDGLTYLTLPAAPDPVVLTVGVSFQLCSSSECWPPTELSVALLLAPDGAGRVSGTAG